MVGSDAFGNEIPGFGNTGNEKISGIPGKAFKTPFKAKTMFQNHFYS